MTPLAGFTRGVGRGIALGGGLGRGRAGRGIIPDDAPSQQPADEERQKAEIAAATAENGYRTQDPVATGLKPHEKAFLNAISYKESGGDYNVRYTPAGGAQFDGFEQHPGIFEDGPEGPSSAAGRYQFTKSTWDDMGGGSFEPENQDTRALALARQRYQASTGRDLDDDLISRGMGADIMSPLSTTWSALKGNQGAISAEYENSLKRYGEGAGGAVDSAVDDRPRKPRTLVDTLAGNVKENIATVKDNLASIGSVKDNWAALRGLLG